MIVFARHAERGDNEYPSRLSEIEYDPPIIEAGHATIKQACEDLTEIFQSKGIKKFQIISSKFLRCLMTASKMQENLQKSGFIMSEKEYQIDDRISQYLRQDWFTKYPLDNLIFHSQKYLANYVPPILFKQSPQQISQIPFPQNYIKFHQRVLSFKKSLKFPQKDTCLLIVTHGFVLRTLCFTMNQLPNYQRQIKYCGYAAYVKENNGQVLVKAKL